MKTRNILYIVSISALLMTSVCCYFMIDWEEVEEYNEMYSPTDCCSCPSPPYVLEQMFMYIFLIFAIMVVIVWLFDYFGVRK